MKTLKTLKTSLLHIGCVGFLIVATFAINCYMEEGSRLVGGVSSERIEAPTLSPLQLRKAKELMKYSSFR